MHAIEGLFKNFQEDSKSVKSRISLKVRTLVGSVNCLHYRMRKISFLKKVDTASLKKKEKKPVLSLIGTGEMRAKTRSLHRVILADAIGI